MARTWLTGRGGGHGEAPRPGRGGPGCLSFISAFLCVCSRYSTLKASRCVPASRQSAPRGVPPSWGPEGRQRTSAPSWERPVAVWLQVLPEMQTAVPRSQEPQAAAPLQAHQAPRFPQGVPLDVGEPGVGTSWRWAPLLPGMVRPASGDPRRERAGPSSATSGEGSEGIGVGVARSLAGSTTGHVATSDGRESLL